MNKQTICGIYKIISPSGRVYIGQSMDIKRRWASYQKVKSVEKQVMLYHSFLKYGVEAHKFEIVHVCQPHQLNDLEIYYGELFDCINPTAGLNLRIGNARGKSSPISNEKNSRTHKMLYKLGLITNPMKGVKQSAEFIKKRVDARAGYSHSSETRATMSVKHKGNKYCLGLVRSTEERKKNSDNKKKSWAEKRDQRLSTNPKTYKKYSKEVNLKKGRKKEKHSQWGKGIPVIQFDLNNVRLTEYNTPNEAVRSLGYEIGGSNIIKCCNNKIPTAYGYKWKFAS